MADFLPPIVGRLLGDTSDYNQKLSGATQTTDRETGQMESRGARLRQGISNHFTAISGVVTGAGVALAKMGADSEQAEARLRVAIENTGRSMDTFQSRIGKTSDKMIQLGFDDEDAARAMAKLTDATQDPQKAIDNMGLVADLAANKHISLETAAAALAKTMSGSPKLFKEYGIAVAANATPQEKNAALMELQRRVAGQAAAQHDNFGGKLQTLKIRAENIAEAFGSKVGPAMTMIGPVALGLSQIMGSGLGGAMLGAGRAVITFGAQAIAGGISAAAAALPVIIAWAPVILTIGALIAIGFLLVKHWDTIWGAIKDGVGAAVGFIRNHIELFLGILFLPLGAFFLLRDHWRDLWEGMKSIAGAAIGLVEGLVKGYVNTILWPINFLIDQLNKIEIHIPSVGIGPIRTPGFDWDGLGLPNIPTLQFGGRFVSGGLALVGEDGPELARFPAGAEVSPLHGRGGGGGVVNVNVVVTGNTILGADQRKLAQQLTPSIREELIRQGVRGDLGLAS